MRAIATYKSRSPNIAAIPTVAKEISKEQSLPLRAALDQELFLLQELMWGAKTHSVLMVLQGRDTAGKDGTIKEVVGALNPRGVSVVSFGVPSQEEREHDFLWRVHKHAPRSGEFAIFNRSHYEDVLVVRVHDLAPKKIWQPRYAQINSFEETLAQHGCIVLKFFLHISKREQKERLLAREKDATKAWKLNPSDWRERDYWQEFTSAYDDAISKTTTKAAPWFIVPADNKWYRNLCVSEAVVKALRPYRDGWLQTLEERGKMSREVLTRFKRKHKVK